MKTWLVSGLGLLVSFYFADIKSSSIFFSVLCPIFAVLFSIVLLFKFFFCLASIGGGSGGHDGSGSGSFGGGDSGGSDSGGC